MRRRRLLIGAGLGASLVADFLLRAYRAAEPFDGYLAFNEGWYVQIARNYTFHTLFSPMVRPGQLDLNLPPFFSYLLFIVWRMFHGGEQMFRMVPIVFDVAACAMVFVLGKRFYGAACGLAAAAFFAVAPICVVVGRNVQTDAVWLFFALAALEAWMRSERGLNLRWTLISGLCVGFAFFTKPTSIMIPVGAAIWELSRGGERPKRIAALLIPAFAVPAPFYIYQLAVHGGGYLAAQKDIAGWAVGGATNLLVSPWELFWGFSPPLLAAAAVGVLVALWKRESFDILCLVCIAAVAAFFAKWHLHSYYLRPLAPFVFLLAGRWLAKLPRREGILLALTLAASGAVFSLVYLGAAKYGFNGMKTIEAEMRGNPGAMLLVRNEVWGNLFPVVDYYGGGAQVAPESMAAHRAARKPIATPLDRDVYLLGFFDGSTDNAPGERITTVRETFALMVAGFEISGWAPNLNFFNLTNFHARRVAPLTRFGMIPTGSMPALSLVRLPRGAAVRARGDRIYP